jgi:hypothetical protein
MPILPSEELIITDTGGVDKYRISYNASTD